MESILSTPLSLITFGTSFIGSRILSTWYQWWIRSRWYAFDGTFSYWGTSTRNIRIHSWLWLVQRRAETWSRSVHNWYIVLVWYWYLWPESALTWYWYIWCRYVLYFMVRRLVTGSILNYFFDFNRHIQSCKMDCENCEIAIAKKTQFRKEHNSVFWVSVAIAT